MNKKATSSGLRMYGFQGNVYIIFNQCQGALIFLIFNS